MNLVKSYAILLLAAFIQTSCHIIQAVGPQTLIKNILTLQELCHWLSLVAFALNIT